MEDRHYAILRKENFNGFISALSKLHKLVAPVFKGYNNYAFEEVNSGEEIALKYIPTILPPKKFFMPVHETLLEYDLSNGLKADAVTEYEEMFLFGVHTCDIAGIQCLNLVFSEHPEDHNYLIHKQNIKIIGLECSEYCDEFANCHLLNTHMPDGGYDLFFTDLGDHFIVHINTQTGEEIIESAGFFESAKSCHLEELALFREKKRALFKNELPIESEFIPDLFDGSFESNVWNDLDERCLACGNCTNVCPTCYCFDIRDEIDLCLTKGVRYRVWDSCQLEPFAKVAGGKNFRHTRKERQRHRYYRKFRYPVNKFSRFFCTGCGRCSRTCMAGIRLDGTLKALIEFKEGAKAKTGLWIK
ncbi:MAG: 4Fe-4S dicluster domain-containing protein [Euryarchaeota archaeon]|nr:4Fe-4S dicluster domain-containing protein [Euryarchaeota archaeon]